MHDLCYFSNFTTLSSILVPLATLSTSANLFWNSFSDWSILNHVTLFLFCSKHMDARFLLGRRFWSTCRNVLFQEFSSPSITVYSCFSIIASISVLLREPSFNENNLSIVEKTKRESSSNLKTAGVFNILTALLLGGAMDAHKLLFLDYGPSL